ncbi:MAG: PPK2 family polyphosphate:nucleotide phosphotransferase [Candidatus Aldehydirespiratoraceae bacterium]|jgi:PPK2 family polyphosphate:nucleotide phosphotransferase
MDLSKYRVSPGQTVDLADWATNDKGEFDRDDAEHRTGHLNDRLEELQEVLYAEGKHKVLVVIQATDTGGKDGTIRHVFDKVNPQGVKVASFKRPTDEELAHDYLWRVHQHTPKSGGITIFNRSHYEDVLVVRIHDIVPKERWSRRYDHINNFEQLLADEGTTIIKLFLHISKDEQKERLQDRLDEPDKNWKFDAGDLREREHWDDYQEAFRVMLERTSTADAPWYVIPANRKWFRNLLISEIIVDALDGLNMAFPEAEDDLEGLEIV